jgi:hypothetical protein
MSERELTASEEAQDDQPNDSVYDFLYHDVRRVGSFLAQFDEAGHLQQVTQSESATRGQSRGFRFAAGGEVAQVGSGHIDVSRTPLSGASEGSERVYDPLWTNARALLDYLQEREMVQRNLAEVRIGQFVLVSGTLAVLDLPMLQQLWEVPIVQATIKSGVPAAAPQLQTGQPRNRSDRRRDNRKPTVHPTIAEDPVGFMIGLIKYLPHLIQARLKTNDNIAIWCSLREESLVVSSADLVLKHGTVLTGTWTIVGILDAMPEHLDPQSPDPSSVLDDAPLAHPARTLGPLVRQLMGRPAQAYGITPLLIFREVSA